MQRPEAKRLKAGAIQKPAQGTETQHLGIRDPRPPKLSGNNALLKELAEGTNRVRKSSDISCFSVSQSSNGGPCDCCLAAADMPADHAAELAAEAGLCACPRALWHAVTPLLCRLQAKQARQQGADWMFGGSGAYAPHPGSRAVDMKLRLHETVSVFDIGLAPHPARALLDSGALCSHSMHNSL